MPGKLAVLTSGGDAPGMNAAIRAVVRTALEEGREALGVVGGYAGLCRGDFRPLGARDVGGVMQQAGTMLRTSRHPAFSEETERRKALAALEAAGVEGLVAIGGNGTQAGARALHRMGLAVAGVASTIDNDLQGSEQTIGVDTALNIALESIDRLKATASSHGRAFVVEVMGRDCGYLALTAALAGGAEAVIVPEVPADPDAVAAQIGDAYRRGKPHAIVVAAEGARCDARALERHIKENHARLGFELRATILGHVQRGGRPTACDRLLGSRLGAAAALALCRGHKGVLAGWVAGRSELTPYEALPEEPKRLDPELLELARVLAR